MTEQTDWIVFDLGRKTPKKGFIVIEFALRTGELSSVTCSRKSQHQN